MRLKFRKYYTVPGILLLKCYPIFSEYIHSNYKVNDKAFNTTIRHCALDSESIYTILLSTNK